MNIFAVFAPIDSLFGRGHRQPGDEAHGHLLAHSHLLAHNHLLAHTHHLHSDVICQMVSALIEEDVYDLRIDESLLITEMEWVFFPTFCQNVLL